jgi:hypothetical protein
MLLENALALLRGEQDERHQCSNRRTDQLRHNEGRDVID